MSLKDLIFIATKHAPKDKILLASPTKDDAVDAIAYLQHVANVSSRMPRTTGIITNLRDPEEEVCRFEMQELEAVLSGRKEPADDEG